MHPESTPDPTLGRHELAASISQEMIRIHADSYGHGEVAARTYILDDLVLSVIDIELLPSEQVLVDSGQPELVRQARHGFQEAIDASFKAAVERATGRTVIAFISDIHLDPHFMVELFKLDHAITAAGGESENLPK